MEQFVFLAESGGPVASLPADVALTLAPKGGWEPPSPPRTTIPPPGAATQIQIRYGRNGAQKQTSSTETPYSKSGGLGLRRKAPEGDGAGKPSGSLEGAKSLHYS